MFELKIYSNNNNNVYVPREIYDELKNYGVAYKWLGVVKGWKTIEIC